MRLPFTFAVITLLITWILSLALAALLSVLQLDVVLSYIMLIAIFGALLAISVRTDQSIAGTIGALVCGAASVGLIGKAMMLHDTAGQTWLQLYETSNAIAMLLLFGIAFWVGSIVGGMICLSEISRRFA